MTLADGASTGDLVASARAGEREERTMYANASSYKIAFTDREISFIRSNIETYIRNKGWTDFFRAAYAGTEMIDLLTILRKCTDCEIVTMDRHEIKMIVDVLSSADNTLGCREELIRLKDNLDAVLLDSQCTI